LFDYSDEPNRGKKGTFNFSLMGQNMDAALDVKSRIFENIFCARPAMTLGRLAREKRKNRRP